MGFEIFGTKHLGAQRPTNVQRFETYCVPTNVKREWGDGSRWTLMKDRPSGNWVIFSPSRRIRFLSYGFGSFEEARAAFVAGSSA
jgi:hypothetical protein